MPTVDVARPKDSPWEHIAHQKAPYAPRGAHHDWPKGHYLNPRQPTPSTNSSSSVTTPLTPLNLSMVPKMQPQLSIVTTARIKKASKSLASPASYQSSAKQLSRVTTCTKKVKSCAPSIASVAESLSPSCSASQVGVHRQALPANRPPRQAVNESWQLWLDCHRHIPIHRGVVCEGGWKHLSSWECSKGLR
jgi:hypothetical protein